MNGFAGRWEWLDALGVFGARYLVFIVFAAAFVPAAVLWRRTRDRRKIVPALALAVRAWVAAGAAFAGNFLFSLLWSRPRPFAVLKDVHQLVMKPVTDRGFPSDHSTASFAVAFTVVAAYPRLGTALLALAATVAVSRVFVGVHYPGDIIAGAFAGLFWAVIVRVVSKRIPWERTLRRLPKRLRAALGI